MPEGDNIYNYTAADIERYHKGLLSPKEMHAIEKAALDDPFLADALDGYGSVAAATSADIPELENRLEERIGGKVVTMYKRRGFIWLRVAAAVVLIVATGLLVYQFGFNKKSESGVANLEKEKQQDVQKTILPVAKDSQQATVSTTAPAAIDSKQTDVTFKQLNSTYIMPVTDSNRLIEMNSNPAFNVVVPKVKLLTADSSLKFFYSTTKPASNANGITAGYYKNETKASRDQFGVVKQEADKENGRKMILPLTKDNDGKKDTLAFSEQLIGVSDDYLAKKVSAVPITRANLFRGRVVDNNNNALPFASVTNTRDNVGTYADAMGNFTLVSTDSVLNVQVHSVGFINNQAVLRSNVKGDLVMQEDRSMGETVLSNKAFNQKRSREANIKVEEPEPIDGWPNYDNYIANNVKMPEEIKMKESEGYVEISFEVNKNGEPVNIKVEKSLCDQCDKEAIRLIKEGPKWKKKGKKRVTVNVPFGGE